MDSQIKLRSKPRTKHAWDGEAAHSYDDAAVSMGSKVQQLTDRLSHMSHSALTLNN